MSVDPKLPGIDSYRSTRYINLFYLIVKLPTRNLDCTGNDWTCSRHGRPQNMMSVLTTVFGRKAQCTRQPIDSISQSHFHIMPSIYKPDCLLCSLQIAERMGRRPVSRVISIG